MKKLCLGAGALALIAMGANAAERTYQAWGHTFTYADFTPQTLDITVATEKGSGHRMNLVRLKNGHMMALVPADRYVALMTTSDDDMLQ